MVRFTLREGLLLTVLVALNILVFVWPHLRYDALVVHHTASHYGDYESVRRAHQARGWIEIGYHAVLSNGSTDVPFGHLYPTWRYRLGLWSVATRSPRFNARALHLSVVGDFEQSAVPVEMQRALGHAISELMDRHSLSPKRIFLHRDCSATACPGRHIDREKLVAWLDLGDQAPTEIQAQHGMALGRFTSTAMTCWIALNGLVIYPWLRRRTRRRPKAARTERNDSAAKATPNLAQHAD